MKISLCTISFRHHLVSLAELAIWAQTNQFQGIELWAAHGRNLASQPHLNGNWLAAFGLEVPMVSDYLPHPVLSGRWNKKPGIYVCSPIAGRPGNCEPLPAVRAVQKQENKTGKQLRPC